MKKLLLLSLVILSIPVIGQDKLSVQVGATFNVSDDEFNNTTALGLYLEPNYQLNDKIRLGARIEPTALAYGILTLEGNCSTGCKEGGNFLLINYLKGEYLLGQPKYGPNNGKRQAYVGVNLAMLTHRRYIITSRAAGNWENTRRVVTNLGVGPRFGVLLGRIDLSASYILTGSDFRNFVGLNLGYRFWNF